MEVPTDRQTDGHSLYIRRLFLTSQRTPKTDFSICTVVITVHKIKLNVEFNIHRSVHRQYISRAQPTRCNVSQIYLFL